MGKLDVKHQELYEGLVDALIEGVMDRNDKVLATARQFLKDQHITADLDNSRGASTLKTKIADFDLEKMTQDDYGAHTH